MKLSGPQADRDRMLSGRGGGNMREDILGRREHDQAVENELGQLRQENKALRDQVSRAMKELKALQIKCPSPYVAVHGDDDADAGLWAAKPEIMTPLLEAYDSRILELEDLNRQQVLKLQDFSSK
eukprot:gene41595-50761_t